MMTQKFLKGLTILTIFSLCGCKTIQINVIDKKDFFSIESGSLLKTPEGEVITINKDGRFLTNGVLQRLANVKVNAVK